MKATVQSPKIVSLVEKLIDIYIGEEVPAQIRATLNGYLIKILGSCLAANKDYDLTPNLISKQVFNLARDNNDATINNKIYHLQGLLDELSKKKVFKNKMSILYLLYKLSLAKNQKDIN